MKNLLSLFALILGLVFVPAQTSQKVAAKNAKTTQAAKKSATAAPAGTKLKKDGTPDKRYKANKKLKKDGTLDRRFKENKK